MVRRRVRTKRRRPRTAAVSTWYTTKANARSARGFKRNRRSNMPRFAVKASALTGCSADYLKVLYNPFGANITELPCIPDFRQIPAQRFYLRRRFEFTTFSGTTGAGAGDLAYVLLNPYTIAGTGVAGAAPDYAAVSYTNGGGAAVTGVVVPQSGAVLPAGLQTAVGAGVTETMWDSPYTNAFAVAVENGNTFRCVAAGIRVNYAGKWEDLQGSYLVWKSPQNIKSGPNSLASAAWSFDDLMAEDSAAYGAMSHNTSLECTYHPVNNSDYEWNYGTDDGYIMAIVIKCPSTFGGVAPTFQGECIGWYELSGPGALGGKPGHADPVGLAKVVGSYKTQEPEKSGLQRVGEAMLNIVKETAYDVASGVGNALLQGTSRGTKRMRIG